MSDDISLVEVEHINIAQILTSGQVTDSYLRAAHGGRLATFGRRLSTKAVKGAKAATSPDPQSMTGPVQLHSRHRSPRMFAGISRCGQEPDVLARGAGHRSVCVRRTPARRLVLIIAWWCPA